MTGVPESDHAEHKRESYERNNKEAGEMLAEGNSNRTRAGLQDRSQCVLPQESMSQR